MVMIPGMAVPPHTYQVLLCTCSTVHGIAKCFYLFVIDCVVYTLYHYGKVCFLLCKHLLSSFSISDALSLLSLSSLLTDTM